MSSGIFYSINGGPANQARDDLALGAVTIVDSGDAAAHVWTMTDRPPGSAAVIVSAGASCSFNMDVVGSYDVTCVADGGVHAWDTQRIVCAVRTALTSQAVADTIHSSRSISFREEGEFTSQPNNPTLPNEAGYSREMEVWLSRIANYGYGVQLMDGGVWKTARSIVPTAGGMRLQAVSTGVAPESSRIVVPKFVYSYPTVSVADGETLTVGAFNMVDDLATVLLPAANVLNAGKLLYVTSGSGTGTVNGQINRFDAVILASLALTGEVKFFLSIPNPPAPFSPGWLLLQRDT
jgi:hypothetical protein